MIRCAGLQQKKAGRDHYRIAIIKITAIIFSLQANGHQKACDPRSMKTAVSVLADAVKKTVSLLMGEAGLHAYSRLPEGHKSMA